MRKLDVQAILADRILRQEAGKAARAKRDGAVWAAFVNGVQKTGGMRRVSDGELLGFVQEAGWPEPGGAEEWLDRLFARKLERALRAAKRRVIGSRFGSK